MSLDFKPQPGSAIDSNSGLAISYPRMLPAEPPSAPNDTEYQYSIYLNDKRFSGVGLEGSNAVVEEAGRRVWTSKLDLGRASSLDSVFKLKRMLSNGDENFTFLRGLAQGLVRVFEQDTNRDYDFRYLALTDATLLAQRGIAVPEDIARLPTGEIILADVFVPAQVEGEDES